MTDAMNHQDRAGQRPLGAVAMTEGVGTPVPLPPEGALVRLDGQFHRVLEARNARFLAVHVATHAMYIIRDAHGGVALPDAAHWNEMVRLGRARTLPGTTPAEVGADEPFDGSMPSAKVNAECGMLAAAGVPMGSKAMAIWLAANWSPELQARFGPHTNVHTLRYWRRFRMRAAAAAQDGRS